MLPLHPETSKNVLETLLVGSVFPSLVEEAKNNAQRRPPVIKALTNLALDHNLQSFETLLTRSSQATCDPLLEQILMLEQVESHLGDMWMADECTESDISLAMVDLVVVLRTIHLRVLPRRCTEALPRSVLVIAEPGELHALPAVMDAEVLYQRGWHSQLEFPTSDKELVERLGSDWFEAVDISLSDVFRRESLLQRLADTVTMIRRHSLNPDVAITVSGRMLRDHQNLLADTGADCLVNSASEVERSIVTAMQAHARPRVKALD